MSEPLKDEPAFYVCPKCGDNDWEFKTERLPGGKIKGTYVCPCGYMLEAGVVRRRSYIT